MAIPEFVLRKLYVKGSLQAEADAFSFALKNTFAPGTLVGLAMDVDGRRVPVENLSLQAEGQPARNAASITPQDPAPLPVGLAVSVQVRGVPLGQGRLTLRADTREAGPLVFTVQAEGTSTRPQRRWALRLPRLFKPGPLRAMVEVDASAVIGEINPHVYGHFVEHLERCVYGGLWTADGSRLREDTLALVRALCPPVIRYPGGNFASGYHWEDGIGPVTRRPSRHDEAWHADESNRVGTDEFLRLCTELGADPFLVVNDGSGTPEEAAGWVHYCNDLPETEQGRRRAANGHPQPYGVRLWGIGNEVWGQWQIGHTQASGYGQRLRCFAEAMRTAAPSFRLVAVGDGPLTDAADDPALRWNELVLRAAGDLIDYLSFHICQPNQEGWRESYDLEKLHHTVCAAPLDVESIVGRMARQIEALAPGREIHVAPDEWNLWLAPPPDAASMHRVVYTLRDALYTAGMLNAFDRCANALALANLAQLVNVLPAIVTDERRAYATPIYYPFLMYRQMEKLALRAMVREPTFDSEALGNIAAHAQVPYLDVTATRDEAGQRLVLGVVNRHPERAIEVELTLRGLESLLPTQAWVLSGPHPLAANSFDMPEQVTARQVAPARLRDGHGTHRFPACSVTVLSLGVG
jgi:alpha-N-arabinofuranosidase